MPDTAKANTERSNLLEVQKMTKMYHASELGNDKSSAVQKFLKLSPSSFLHS